MERAKRRSRDRCPVRIAANDRAEARSRRAGQWPLPKTERAGRTCRHAAASGLEIHHGMGVPFVPACCARLEGNAERGDIVRRRILTFLRRPRPARRLRAPPGYRARLAAWR